MLTVLNGGGASTCTVTSLLKYTLYEFFIVPFYKTVEGKPSNSRISRTLEDGKFINKNFVVVEIYVLCFKLKICFCVAITLSILLIGFVHQIENEQQNFIKFMPPLYFAL